MSVDLTPFFEFMEQLPVEHRRVAVAVSGGGDSLALCLLLHEWTKGKGFELVGLSVDHGLRKEAAQECSWVCEVLSNYGIKHQTLTWEGEKPSSDIQAQARQARYDLMTNWCVENGIHDLFLAHHLDDQAETFLLRLARGSSVDGLSAMSPVTDKNGLCLIRPLLDVPKTALIDYLTELGQDWIEDPSNRNEQYDRVKIRQSMEALSELGFHSRRLTQTADHMSRVRKYLETARKKWLQANTKLFDEGYVELDKGCLFEDENEEIILRALTRIGLVVGSEIYPPRFERLQRLWHKLKTGQDATLMGCRWIVQEDNILVCRETRNLLEKQPVKGIWDYRYSVEVIENKEDIFVRGLGEEGWLQLVQKQPDLKDTHLPRPVIQALVSFWDNEGVLYVPQLGYKRVNKNLGVNVRFNPRIGLFS